MATTQRIVDAADAGTPTETTGRPVTARAFALGLVLALAMCAITPYNDYYVAATYLSGNFFPIGAIGAVLLLVLAVNPLLIALGRRRAIFAPGEIMTVWAMILVVAGVPSSGLMRYLIPHIVSPHYYAKPSNGWDALLVSHLPARLLVTDPRAIHDFFEGLPRGAGIPWQAWASPLAWWLLFVILLFAAFFCFSGLLRRQWVEHERFSFPLVVLPVQLAEPPEPGRSFPALVRSPLLWLGVLAVTLLHTTKGLHLFQPTMPDPTIVWHSSDYLTTKPWNGVNDVMFAIYPLVIGFAYLLSSEVALSLWLFYLLFKAEVLIGSIYQWDMKWTGTGFSMGPAFTVYQEVGGAIMLAVWLLYTMRGHLGEVWRKAAHDDPHVDDRREPLSFRAALFGLAGCYLGLFLWLTLAAEIQPLLVLGLLAGSFLVFLMLSWLVAQAGLLFVTQTFSATQIMTVLSGPGVFHGPSLAMSMIAEHAGWQDAREFMMPPLLNSYKAGGETGLSLRSLTRALAACVALSVVVSAVASLWLPYTHGGGVSLKNPWMYINSPQLPFSWSAAQVRNPPPLAADGLLQMAGGAALVLVLFLARTYIPNFGLHPAGFLAGASYAMYCLWFSLFLGWVVKVPILRYGGIRAYRLLLPFFLGLILGDTLNALVWTVVGLTTGTGYQLLPG